MLRTQPAILASAAKSLKDFLHQESAGGIVLMASALLALILANSPLSAAYFGTLATPIVLTVGGTGIDKSALLWINDGLMALFFLLVGLEVKREVLTGQLSSWKQASLPLFAAIGGMALPALIFILINLGTPENIRGWAIPAATDIAFALGVLALLGKRVPVALKALLLAVAVIDDIGAIIIIAAFYTESVDLGMLGSAAVVLALLAACGRAKVGSRLPYVILGIALWYFVLKSGVHATLAGVALAMCIPIEDSKGKGLLEEMEHGLHPWVAFMVVPIFALANAGVSFTGMQISAVLEPLPLGIALGLLIGKQIGIFGFAWLTVKFGISTLPEGVRWVQIWGLSLIAAIGFTMSLFIGNLAFSSPEMINAVKVGVLSGSVLAAIAGVIILKLSARPMANDAA